MAISIGRPWTEHEDQLLTQAVSVHGENDNWKTIALCIPGRTNKACRKRWLHSLSPSVKKSAWTREEDALLLSLYALHSTRWAVIARHIQGRTDDACSKRYREALDPALKKGDWTPEEDTHLLQAYQRLGGRWGQIGTELSRSGLGCRNRWRLLDRKRATSDIQRSFSESHDPNCCGLQSTSAAWPNATIINIWDPNHEAHSSAPMESGDIDMGLTRSPTPPPFQFSSSSLSAALSNPQPVHRTTVVQQPPESHAESEPYCCDVEPCCESDPYEAELAPSIHEPIPISYPLPTQAEYCQDCPMIYNDPPDSVPISTRELTHIVGSPIEDTDDLPAPEIPSEVDDEPQPELNPIERSGSRARAKKRSKALSNPRLSSLLPVDSDKTVFAYVCGHENCWPVDMQNGSVRFATSKELWDHSKNDHYESMGGSKPFRCGLEGCEKGWKSINGLQYHLQVSKAHFKQALLIQSSHAASLPVELDKDGKGSKPRKKFACPHDGCPNEYLQKSGLRYHLSHGHPTVGPAQLSVLPPALAERMNKNP